ncbi:MAG: hypothetical protein V4642_11925 [Bacteroidota bacterium]
MLLIIKIVIARSSLLRRVNLILTRYDFRNQIATSEDLLAMTAAAHF